MTRLRAADAVVSEERPVTLARRPAHARPALLRARDTAFIVALHAVPAVAVVLGTTVRDWVACAVFYVVAAMGTGVGLHRYFAHHAFRTSRTFQFVLAVLAGTAFAEPISFAGKHRLHHRHADTDGDVHSPRQGFWFCWFGSLVDEGYRSDEVLEMARDLARYPELVWLRRWFFMPGVAVGAATWWLGGFSTFAIGFVLSRALLLNLVSTVNFFCHLNGTRRYATGDASTNHALVSLLTFGEGWHNNHHHYPGAARAGFRWWELDPVYYVIRALAWLGLVWDVREVPPHVRDAVTG
jgi:stearoyl-CoA desaturase (Delta-9 desaturase)